MTATGLLGTTDSGLGELGLGVASTITPIVWRPTGQLGTDQSAPGNIELGTSGAPPVSILAAGAGLRGVLLAARHLYGRLVAGAGLTGALAGTPSALSGRMAAGATLTGRILVANHLSGRLAAGAALRGIPTVHVHLSGRIGGGTRLIVVSTGPGTGLIVGGQTQADWLRQLQPGDTFPALLPGAGLFGLAGTGRVTAVETDTNGIRTYHLAFVPYPDVSEAIAEATSGAPRYQPPTRANAARRLADLERTTNQRPS